MTKKIKIILAIFLIALAIGYTALYHWAKNRFTELYQESKQQIQAEGWIIEDSPLMFSGFPFRLTANQEKFKMSKNNGANTILGDAQNLKMHVSIINPFKHKVDGIISMSINQNDKIVAKILLGNGTITMGHKEGKLEITSFILHTLKAEFYTPEGTSSITLQTQGMEYAEGEHKINDTNDGKVLQLGSEISIKDLEVTAGKEGVITPLLHLKKVKATTKGKMPLALAENIKAIFKNPTTSPIAQICQAGGKVPPLKDTLNLMEKVGSTGKLDVEVEHNNYVINLDLDAKVLNGAPELLLTTQVNNLNSLFDAFNLDPTMRLIANGFVKKESNQSEKAHLIVKLSTGSLFVNDMEIMKVPMPDWDNIVLPADVCSKYTAVAATKATTPAVPIVLPVTSPL